MTWSIGLTTKANKFLKANQITKEEVFESITKTIQKLQGEDINIDVKKLRGKWSGFLRIRKGKLRIIAEFNFDNLSVLIEEIDWRGGAYK